MGNGIVDGVLVDPQAWFFSQVQGKNPANYEQVLRDMEPDLFHFGIGQQTDGSGNVLRGRLFLPWGACPNAAPRSDHPQDVKFHVNQEGPCCGIGEVPCLQVDVVNNPPTQWVWNVGGGKTMADYVPVQQEAPPDSPPTGDLPLMILDYQTVVRRSDPKGFTLYFDGGSDAPVVEAKAGFNDNAPPLHVTFPPPFPPQGTDGRYHRGFVWKPVVSGQWKPWVWVKDSAGREGRIEGTEIVTVTE